MGRSRSRTHCARTWAAGSRSFAFRADAWFNPSARSLTTSIDRDLPREGPMALRAHSCRHDRVRWLAGVLLAGAALPALAGSGFELRSQSASTLGSAQAGMTCGVADVSTIVF